MKNRGYYLKLKYPIILEKYNQDEYIARLADILNITGFGSTEEEAKDDLKEAFEIYIDFAIDKNIEIQEPTSRVLCINSDTFYKNIGVLENVTLYNMGFDGRDKDNILFYL